MIFSIPIGVQQGSTLSSYIFILVLVILTSHSLEIVPWCMLFAKDIVMVRHLREELWRQALELHGLCRSIFEVSHSNSQ